ncbi:MAG: Crp/Fnr family transcriptional regulator [Flavobacteriales bacterium]
MSELKNIEKGTLIQRQGDKASCIFKVHSGLLRSFFVDKMGKEHVFMFAPIDWIISDLDAFGFGTPCALSIEAMEPSLIEFVPSHQGKLPLPALEGGQDEFIRLMRHAGTLQRRVLMMMSSSALERYEYFLETYPDLSPRLTQKLIASYLGITPQRLSMIRAERVGK